MAARLSLLYKSIHHRATINSDHLNQNPNKVTGVQTCSTKSISFIRVPANKDCYKHSILPNTTAEWNLLPAAVREAPSPNTFKKPTQLKPVKYQK